MPRIATVEICQYDELTDSAKEKARDWYRETNSVGYDWSEHTVADYVQTANELGIQIYKPRGCDSGHAVYFCLDSGREDGTSFDGAWSAQRCLCPLVMPDKFPLHFDMTAKCMRQVRELYRIEEMLHAIAANNVDASVRINASSRYYRISCDTYNFEENGMDDVITQLMEDFARLIHQALTMEWEYLNSDTEVEDAIIANGYEFETNGKRARF